MIAPPTFQCKIVSLLVTGATEKIQASVLGATLLLAAVLINPDVRTSQISFVTRRKKFAPSRS